MALYLAPAALGLGDLVVTLPVVQQLIARGETVYLVVRAEEHVDLARRVPGIAGTRLEWEVPECLNPGDKFIDLRDHPLEKVAWWGSKPWLDAYPGWTVNDILGTICGDKGLRVDFDAPYTQLKFARRAELADKVVLVPGSAVSAKMWDAKNWQAIARALSASGNGASACTTSTAASGNGASACTTSTAASGNGASACSTTTAASGHGAAVVVAASQELVELLAPIPWHVTSTIADALDAVSSARAVIAVDTGIMHIAVHQGTPTVGIFRSQPVYARQCEHFIPVVASKACESACYMREIGCGHNGRPLAGKEFIPTDWSCQATPDQQHCLDTITPSAVLAALDDAINRRGRRHQRTGTLL